MNIFCSYAFAGEDETELHERMRRVVNTLACVGHKPYAILFDRSAKSKHGQPPATALRYALDKMQSCDVVVLIVSSERRSVGQLIEVGAAIVRGKPIYLFEHASARGTSYLSDIVDSVASWRSLDELEYQLRVQFRSA